MIQRIFNNKTFYTRFRLPTIRERYLIRWQPNHSTKIHSHNNKSCKFYLLYGELQENKYIYKGGVLKDGKSNILNNFLDSEYIDDTMGKHSIHNILDRPSYSYHVYE